MAIGKIHYINCEGCKLPCALGSQVFKQKFHQLGNETNNKNESKLYQVRFWPSFPTIWLLLCLKIMARRVIDSFALLSHLHLRSFSLVSSNKNVFNNKSDESLLFQTLWGKAKWGKKKKSFILQKFILWKNLSSKRFMYSISLLNTHLGTYY